MTTRKFLLAGALALGFAAPALAQSAPGQRPDFAPRDPYGDATVTRAQAEAEAAARFDAVDTNHDGKITKAEVDALRATLPPPPTAGAAPPPPSAPSQAGPPSSRGGGQMGVLRSLERLIDYGPVAKSEFVGGALRRFDRIDADHDGNLTKAEREAGFEAMRARWQERRQNGGNGDGGPPSPPADGQ